MMLLVVGLQTVEYRYCLLDVRVLHDNLLESAVQGAVLLDNLCEFVKGGGSYTLDIASCKCWLEHVCCVKTS